MQYSSYPRQHTIIPRSLGIIVPNNPSTSPITNTSPVYTVQSTIIPRSLRTITPETLTLPVYLSTPPITNTSSVTRNIKNEDYVNEDYVIEDYVNEDYVNENYVNENYVNENYVNENYDCYLDLLSEQISNMSGKLNYDSESSDSEYSEY